MNATEVMVLIVSICACGAAMSWNIHIAKPMFRDDFAMFVIVSPITIFFNGLSFGLLIMTLLGGAADW